MKHLLFRISQTIAVFGKKKFLSDLFGSFLKTHFYDLLGFIWPVLEVKFALLNTGS